ncbi:hypothetical protein C0992_003567 [Termitomyces sp. T32_za158]|nr:hypothetical protein C0992_003567 [Termitomyces sp. T32_za158]
MVPRGSQTASEPLGSADTARHGTVQSQPQNVDDLTPSDSLQVAGQPYPWLYMTSTLDACFQPPKARHIHQSIIESLHIASQKDLETHAQHLTENDHEEQVPAERTAFAQSAPRIMHAFHAHGDACERAEAEAMKLALNPTSTGDDEDGDRDEPLTIYAEMLNTLEQLHTEALELEESILDLTRSSEPHPATALGRDSDNSNTRDAVHDEPAELHPDPDAEAEAQAQVLGVFRACLPVLRARIANLSMARELVDGARENTSISLRMESLGLLD